MTLDDLIKQAENPTPAFKRKLSRRVHKTRKICKHPAIDLKTLRCGCGKKFKSMMDYTMHDTSIPDYTRPENFWPLLDEMFYKFPETSIYCFDQYVDGGRGAYVVRTDWHVVSHKNPGIAVCLAYLKIKEKK